MNGDRLRIAPRAALFLVLLIYLGEGITFLFFQPRLEATFGTKVLDPELMQNFGVIFLGLSTLLFLGLRSGSLKVVKPVMQVLIATHSMVFISNGYHYMFTHGNPLAFIRP